MSYNSKSGDLTLQLFFKLSENFDFLVKLKKFLLPFRRTQCLHTFIIIMWAHSSMCGIYYCFL